jgi:hypothetical protein
MSEFLPAPTHKTRQKVSMLRRRFEDGVEFGRAVEFLESRLFLRPFRKLAGFFSSIEHGAALPPRPSL